MPIFLLLALSLVPPACASFEAEVAAAVARFAEDGARSRPAELNGRAALSVSGEARRGAVVRVQGTVTGTADGFPIAFDYANAVLGVYKIKGEFDVPVAWDGPLPPRLDAGVVLRFHADVPVDKLLVRCEPDGACAFSVQGPFAPGRFRNPGTDLGMARAELPAVRLEPELLERWRKPPVPGGGGEAVFGFRPGVDADAAAEAIGAAEGVIVSQLARTRTDRSMPVMFVVRVPPDLTLREFAERLGGKIEWVEARRR